METPKASEEVTGDAPAPTRIQSVARAARILMAVASSEEGLTVKALADRFKLSTPTTYHLVNTLVSEGLLSKDDRRRYLLGSAASVISDAHIRLNAVSDRYLSGLKALADETGETSYLSAWRNGAISVLASLEGSNAVRVAGLTTGYSDDIHARASGKLLLAFSAENFREESLASTNLRKVTPHTITTLAALRLEFKEIVETDLAYDREEFRVGVACVSAPIRENGVVVACFTLSCPAERFAATEHEILTVLKRVSQMVSQG